MHFRNKTKPFSQKPRFQEGGSQMQFWVPSLLSSPRHGRTKEWSCLPALESAVGIRRKLSRKEGEGRQKDKKWEIIKKNSFVCYRLCAHIGAQEEEEVCVCVCVWFFLGGNAQCSFFFFLFFCLVFSVDVATIRERSMRRLKKSDRFSWRCPLLPLSSTRSPLPLSLWQLQWHLRLSYMDL